MNKKNNKENNKVEWNNLKSLLRKLKFEQCGEIKLTKDKILKFNLDNTKSVEDIKLVYCWVAFNKKQAELLYVGKATKGIIERMKQHERGFLGPKESGSKSGEAKATFIRGLINKKFKISVFIKKPADYTVLDVELTNPINFSGVSFEEDALIYFFKKHNYELTLNKRFIVK